MPQAKIGVIGGTGLAKIEGMTNIEEIERTDKEIDNLVYELYGLTEEERQVIETSLASKS